MASNIELTLEEKNKNINKEENKDILLVFKNEIKKSKKTKENKGKSVERKIPPYFGGGRF